MEKMYGSIHTHFEDSFDAVTDMHTAVRNFLARSAKKVASTSHGTFVQYEDVQDVITEAKNWADEAEKIINGLYPDADYKSLMLDADDEEVEDYILNNNIFGHANDTQVNIGNAEEVLAVIDRIRSFELVPGVEAYFGDETRHMILIAKNEEGYHELSKIISESNYSLDANGKPITTIENLRKNVKAGNIICTSACIGGVFGDPITKYIRKIEKLNKEEEELKAVGYLEAKMYEDEYINIPLAERNALEKITKKAIGEAQKAAKISGDETEVELLKAKYELWDEADKKAKSYAEEYENRFIEVNGEKKKPAAIIKEYKRQGNAYRKLKDEIGNTNLEAFLEEKKVENLLLYMELINIFGKDNFYFEIQNHGISTEKIVYNEILRLAEATGSLERVVAANDIHICVTGENAEELDREIEKRNIAQLGRFDNNDYRDYDDAYDYRPATADEKEYYIKSDTQLKECLKKIIEPIGGFSAEEIADKAVKNVQSILSECSVVLSKDEKHYPAFCEDENNEFDRLVEEGVKRLFPNGMSAEYRERLEYEKEIIKKLGYAGYHLIVQDYISYGRLLGYLNEEQIKEAPLNLDDLKAYVSRLVKEGKTEEIGQGIGPGRGSAAGSLVCFCLGITDLDPIKYGLLFERFLNVDRVSMPDIDTDFNPDIREKVYEYCKLKYGEENVSKIMTKTYLALKGAIKMGSRYGLAKQAYEESISEGDARYEEIKKAYSDAADKMSKTATALLQNASDVEALNRLKVDYTSSVEQNILKYTEEVLGMYTVTGQHAAGVVISKDPIKEVIPVMWNNTRKSFQIQCLMARAEELGLLKMDFLGLKNLRIISKICKNPSLGLPKVDIFNTKEGQESVLENKEVFNKIFATALAHGVFQFESEGMKNMLSEFEPENFEDIIILVSLYRPGPMDFIPEVIQQKWFKKDPELWKQKYGGVGPDGKERTEPKRSITLRNAALEKILEPTYGCPVYQEQIMQIFQEMAGYSLGGADVVRRYMSKKAEAKLAYEKTAFVYGDPERGILGCCKKHGMTVKEAEDLFEQMMPFAKYGFNKSHAACYAKIAVYTAYLKLYRPEDFFRSSMDEMEDVESLEPYYIEAAKKEFGIKILPPSLDSQNGFTTIGKNTILRGFASVKGMGNIPPIKVKTTCAETFIRENPEIPIKNIITIAELGLFETTWESQNEEQLKAFKKYVNGNDEAIADFIDENGKDIRSENEVNAAKERLALKRIEFADIVEKSNEKGVTLQASENKKRKPKTKEYLLGSFAVMTPEYIKSMQEKVRVFSSNYSDKNKAVPTFKTELHTQNDQYENFDKKKSKKIPASVALVKNGKTKAGAPFQNLTLIDINGHKEECRFYLSAKTKPLSEGDVGFFKIPLGDEIKFRGVDYYDERNRFKAKNDFLSAKEINAREKQTYYKSQGPEFKSGYGKTVESVLKMEVKTNTESPQIDEVDDDFGEER